MSLLDDTSSSLGRGLDSLLGGAPLNREGGMVTLPLATLKPGKYQPRQHFKESDLIDLATSIRERGILQPIVVRPTQEHDPLGNPLYEIIAGERRWRAAEKAGLRRIPVIIRELTDQQALEAGLIENIQRNDLNALEEARGYDRLLLEFHYTQDQLSKIIGKSRSHIANTLRLLSLPKFVQDLLLEQKISAGHARALINCDDPEKIVEEILTQNLSVRQTERLVAERQGREYTPAPSGKTPEEKSPLGKEKSALKDAFEGEKELDLKKMEEELTQILGLKASVHLNKQGSEIRIQLTSIEDLDHFFNKILHHL